MTNIPAYRLVTSCKVDSTWYPFDDQTCDIKIGSWVYNGLKVNLKLMAPEEADTSSYITNTEWDLVGAPAERHEVYYECCPEPYVGVNFKEKRSFKTPIVYECLLRYHILHSLEKKNFKVLEHNYHSSVFVVPDLPLRRLHTSECSNAKV